MDYCPNWFWTSTYTLPARYSEISPEMWRQAYQVMLYILWFEQWTISLVTIDIEILTRSYLIRNILFLWLAINIYILHEVMWCVILVNSAWLVHKRLTVFKRKGSKFTILIFFLQNIKIYTNALLKQIYI